MKIFYIVKDGESDGPYSIDELKGLKLKPDSLVWREGFDDWIEASKVEALKPLFKVVPPPVPKKKTPIPPIPKDKLAVSPNPVAEDITAKPKPQASVQPVDIIDSGVFLAGLVLAVLTVIFHVGVKFFIPELVGHIISVILVISVWVCFRAYLVSANDKGSAGRTNWIMLALLLYGIMNSALILGGKTFFGTVRASNSSASTFTTITLWILFALILLVIWSLLKVSASKEKHPLGIFGIVGSSFVFVPSFIFFYAISNIPLFTWLGNMQEKAASPTDAVLTNIMFITPLMIPYILMAILFFKLVNAKK